MILSYIVACNKKATWLQRISKAALWLPVFTEIVGPKA